MAERVGFEPTVPVRVQRFSRPPDSAALAPLRTSVGFSFLAKKRLYHRAALLLKDAALNPNLMIQKICCADAEMSVNRPRLRISSPVHESLYTSMHDCPRAHRARLYGRVQRRAG